MIKGQNTNIKCLVKAGEGLGFSIKYFDKYGNLVLLQKNNLKLWFANYSTPFNTQSHALLARDKSFSHLVLEGAIKTPKFKFYFDPKHPKNKFDVYKVFSNLDKIVEDVEGNFSLPVVVKKNRGEQGKNVFLCQDREEIKKAIEVIFDYKEKYYDYICLVEEYIPISKEYRVVCFDGEILLCYLKDNSGGEFVGNLSPLHFKNAKAVLIEGGELISKLQEFIGPIFKTLPIKFTGLDIIETKDGEFCLLEVNSQPMFKIAGKSFGEESIVEMYQKILKNF